jgi:hypothetical protein
MKKFYLVWFARKKIAKLVMATNATLHHMRKTQMIFSNFFVPKIFKLSVFYSLSFNGTQFLFFAARGKISRKKI